MSKIRPTDLAAEYSFALAKEDEKDFFGLLQEKENLIDTKEVELKRNDTFKRQNSLNS